MTTPIFDLGQALHLAGPCRALMLYGSVARGEQEHGSDIDLLAIVERRRPNKRLGQIQLACYTTSQLEKLAQEGSLFVLHLIVDGVTLLDEQDLVGWLRETYKPQSNYAHLYRELRNVLAITNVAKPTYENARFGLERALLFAARSYIYGQAALSEPCFSVRRLAERGCPIAQTVRKVKSRTGGFADYRSLLELTAAALRVTLPPAYQDLDTLVRHADLTSGLVARLLKLIAPADHDFAYDWLDSREENCFRGGHSRGLEAT